MKIKKLSDLKLQSKRICYGMEIEPKYVAVALERMADMGLKPKLAKK